MTKQQKPGKSSTVDGLYTQLKQKIISFELYPGTRVTEQVLAEMFGVSRTPIRQALQRLEIEGFLSIRPKQGCFIRELDVNELMEYYEARIALELLIVESAVNAMTDKQLEQMMALWHPDIHDNELQHGIDLGEKDESFHVGLALASDKPVLASLLKNINHRIRVIRRLDLNSDNRSQRTYKEHFEILQHIKERDTSKAKQAMKRHIQRSREFAKTLTLTALARQKFLSNPSE
ncbi:GntR family transcriptional regulator [Methylophilus sp. 3sh_L]|uniref:GntR family transcriptional regulator n=1 Tax=Methylophilus sp. 3sh_L TaxID=3377114 RepID=UPI00398E685F